MDGTCWLNDSNEAVAIVKVMWVLGSSNWRKHPGSMEKIARGEKRILFQQLLMRMMFVGMLSQSWCLCTEGNIHQNYGVEGWSCSFGDASITDL